MGGLFSSHGQGDTRASDRPTERLVHKKEDEEPVPKKETEKSFSPQIDEPVNGEAAVTAIKINYDRLIASLQDPLSQLANPLFSKEMIPEKIRDTCLIPTIINSEKSAKLLDAIECRVEMNPNYFFILLHVLQKDPTLDDIATELKDTYDKLCADPNSVEAVHIRLTTEVEQYVRYLTMYYKSATIDPEFKWPPPLPFQNFVTLALVKKEPLDRNKADEFTKATLHGNVDQILSQKEPISMEDVLEPSEDQSDIKCVLLEGAPGIGKSTFAWELCRRSDHIKALRKYSFVLLLRFREKRVQQAQKISDLFYHDDPNIRKTVAKEVIKSNGRGLLFVLDGYDELPTSLRNDSLLVRIIKGRSLPKCTLLITSRPSASQSLRSICSSRISKHIEVLGFNQEQIEKYAETVFASDSSAELDEFLAYISVNRNPAIRSLMYIPLNCSIVTNIYKTNKELGKTVPQTMTQLYSELSLVLIRRYLHNKDDIKVDHLPSKLKDLPYHLYDKLFSLAKVAFHGILDQRIVFDSLPEGCATLGFTTATPELYFGSRGVSSYSFLHLTVQEFLAAFYMSQLSVKDEDYRRFLFKWKQRSLDVMYIFLAGLTSENINHFGWKIIEIKGKHPDDGRISFCSATQSAINARLIHEETYLEQPECPHKDYFSCSTCTTPISTVELDAMHSNTLSSGKVAACSSKLENEIVKLQSSVSKSRDCNCECIVTVRPLLIRCIYEAQEKQVFDSLLTSSESFEAELDVFSTSFDYFALGHCIATYDCSWSVSLCNKGVKSDDVQMIVNGLKSVKTVQGTICELDLHGIPLGQQGVENLHDLPEKIVKELVDLDISSCYMHPYTLCSLDLKKFVANTIPLMTSLHTLDVSCNPLTENGVSSLLEALSGSTLEKLVIVDNGIQTPDIHVLSSMLQSTRLIELVIGGGNWEPLSVECTNLLMKVVFQQSSLQTVDIIFSDFGQEAETCIHLAENNNLLTLALISCVNVNPALVQLSKALEDNEMLEKLYVFQVRRHAKPYLKLRDKVIDPVSVFSLSKMIKTNRTLEYLELYICGTLKDAFRLFFSLALENKTLDHLALPIIGESEIETCLGWYRTVAYAEAFHADRRASLLFGSMPAADR